MARVSALIDINTFGGGTLTRIVTNKYTNNFSKNPHSNEIVVKENSLTDTIKNDGLIVYPYEVTKYSDKPTFFSEKEPYNGYMYGLTDASGYYELKLALYGFNLFKLAFYFDKTAHQYPTHYIVQYLDGTTAEFNCDETNEDFNKEDLSITIFFQSGTDINLPQYVTFDKWERPNYNVSITFIEALSAKLEIGSAWITNISSTAEQNPNPEEISYGCLANTGSISINDIDETLFTYAQYGYLDINAFNISLFFNRKEIQYHIPNDSPYFSDESILELSLTNTMTFWNNIECAERTYTEPMTLYRLFVSLMNEYLNIYSASDIDNILSNIIVTEIGNVSVQAYMHSIIIPPFTLEKDSLTNNINKICTVAQLNLIEDDNGNLKFYSARPVITREMKENALVITPVLQTEKPTSSILVSNRYDGVIID